eukprot:6191050-Pleurochrysis_carterae.AAC.1
MPLSTYFSPIFGQRQGLALLYASARSCARERGKEEREKGSGSGREGEREKASKREEEGGGAREEGRGIGAGEPARTAVGRRCTPPAAARERRRGPPQACAVTKWDARK